MTWRANCAAGLVPCDGSMRLEVFRRLQSGFCFSKLVLPSVGHGSRPRTCRDLPLWTFVVTRSFALVGMSCLHLVLSGEHGEEHRADPNPLRDNARREFIWVICVEVSLAITELCQLVHAVNASPNTVQIVLSLRIFLRKGKTWEKDTVNVAMGSNTAPLRTNGRPRETLRNCGIPHGRATVKRATTICSSTCGLFQRAMGARVQWVRISPSHGNTSFSLSLKFCKQVCPHSVVRNCISCSFSICREQGLTSLGLRSFLNLSVRRRGARLEVQNLDL